MLNIILLNKKRFFQSYNLIFPLKKILCTIWTFKIESLSVKVYYCSVFITIKFERQFLKNMHKTMLYVPELMSLMLQTGGVHDGAPGLHPHPARQGRDDLCQVAKYRSSQKLMLIHTIVSSAIHPNFDYQPILTF